LGIVLVVAGMLFLWLATEAGWFGLDSDVFSGIPMVPLMIGLIALLLIWLWRRRAKWH
jgi:hypothetical protein